ncbi:MAG: HIT domain-containing protein [Candidatus Dormibacteraeota bacterium]|nr:HIT domain-containing protein [Candidatus Dormibacteraeota bacterium]
MRQIWAPWRGEFITGPKPSSCFLCEAATASPVRDAELHVLARTASSLAILNRYPYNNGHLLVAPRAHLARLQDLPGETAIDLTLLSQRALRALAATLKPEGFNLGINQGKVAGAGVADHVHQHIVPRWSGDTNFMPVLSDVKVMNEHLDASYEAIRQGFERVP